VRSFAGTPLRCLLMVIPQQAAQSLAALNMPVAAGVCTPREQQDIALPLVVPFGMEMFDIFAQRSPQRALAKEDHLAQARGNDQLPPVRALLICKTNIRAIIGADVKRFCHRSIRMRFSVHTGERR
jgi:hypothetical protein